MATSKRHTYQEILNTGIYLPDNDQTIKINKVFIPRIQRSYAQGRKSEHEIRSNFLDDIFSTLCNDKDHLMELSFLFGSKQPLTSGGYGFELLDGQQRVTTLFLLHWYLWMKEHEAGDEQVPDYLKKFTYETRDTSTQFINKIVDCPISMGEDKPSKVIKAFKWFTEVFNCDATVCSMLTMLDAIDDKYKESKRDDLYAKLTRLQFYVLYLEEFELNDELYIKMNSRGLDLTPFENFKASLIRYMKKRGGKFTDDVFLNDVKMPYYLSFSTKMDTTWNDIFWALPNVPCDPNGIVNNEMEINNLDKDEKFFRFIVRYFFTKLVLDYDDQDKDYKSLEGFLYKNTYKEGELATAESEHALRERLVGWEYFQMIIDMLGYEGICKFEKVLDIFAKYYNSDISSIINSNPYKTNKKWDVYGEYKDFTLPNRVVFAAIVEFIEKIPSGKDLKDNVIQKNLNQLFRIMWNVIENTKIEDVKPAISVIKAMSEMINLPGAVNRDFYSAIAQNSISSRNVQLDEEIVKAKKISENYSTDIDWEDKFKQAEIHPFFKGMVRFFFDESIINSTEFENRYNVVQKLFDSSGITPKYRKNHILIRALMSQMNFWEGNDGLEKKYITENAENEGYLKILLGTRGAKNVFCNYFNFTFPTIERYFNILIQNAQWNSPHQKRFCRVFNRLVNHKTSIELLNQISSIEKQKQKRFHIVKNDDVIMVCIPYNDRIVLDTERHLIIRHLTSYDGFKFTYDDQRKSMESSLEDTWWAKVYLQKDFADTNGNNIKLMIEFDTWRCVEFYIKIESTDITPISDLLETQSDRYHFKIIPPIKYDDYSDYKKIKSQIDFIEKELKAL